MTLSQSVKELINHLFGGDPENQNEIINTLDSAITALQPVDSHVALDTGNGFGSVNTCIRRFTNITSQSGSDITYTDTVEEGAKFVINTTGIYAMTYTDGAVSTGTDLGVSLNSTHLTSNIFDVPAGEKLGEGNAYTNYFGSFAITTRLQAGDIIRPHADGLANFTYDSVQFTITRIV